MCLPEVGFLVPPAPFAHEGNGQQFGITTGGNWSQSGKLGGEGRVGIADEDVHPGAEIGKVGYHEGGLRYELWSDNILLSVLRPLVNQNN